MHRIRHRLDYTRIVIGMIDDLRSTLASHKAWMCSRTFRRREDDLYKSWPGSAGSTPTSEHIGDLGARSADVRNAPLPRKSARTSLKQSRVLGAPDPFYKLASFPYREQRATSIEHGAGRKVIERGRRDLLSDLDDSTKPSSRLISQRIPIPRQIGVGNHVGQRGLADARRARDDNDVFSFELVACFLETRISGRQRGLWLRSLRA